MDRWRSGTPETCHSSHHHAICTPSPSFSHLCLLRFIRSIISPLPSVQFFFLSHFQRLSWSISSFLSLPPTISRSLLWRSFLGFIISSGNVPSFFSPSLVFSFTFCVNRRGKKIIEKRIVDEQIKRKRCKNKQKLDGKTGGETGGDQS